MPENHVRFAERDQVFSPSPSTPSPTFSQSSLPSSPGVSTPPPVIHTGSPYSTTPLPQGDDEPRVVWTTVNPYIGFSPDPAISWDVSYKPSTNPPNSSPSNSTSSLTILEQPATSPPLASITIVCALLPWDVVIRASGKPDACVTIRDVIMGIYSMLRIGASPNDFAGITESEERKSIEDAFRHRYERLSDPRRMAEEFEKGLKRVDFLRERHRFLGLSSTAEGPDVWEMHVA